jgi:zinc finger SWIM domain-containing protein 3
VFHDSFTADMTSTQRSEGMNNVFKKRFCRKLGISELLVECEKVSASLRANERDADLQSRQKDQVIYTINLPMLKTAAESYTKRMYSEFEAEFKDQLLFSGTVLKTEGSISTYMVTHMQSDYGHKITFNDENMTITCSCRKFKSIGMYTFF